MPFGQSVKLQDEIAKLHKTFGITTIMISHDAEASYALADRIIVLDQGKVIKDGSKDDILKQTTLITYGLIG